MPAVGSPPLVLTPVVLPPPPTPTPVPYISPIPTVPPLVPPPPPPIPSGVRLLPTAVRSTGPRPAPTLAATAVPPRASPPK